MTKQISWQTKGYGYEAQLHNADKGEFLVKAETSSRTELYNFYTCLTACCNGNSWEVAKKLMSLLTDEEKKV